MIFFKEKSNSKTEAHYAIKETLVESMHNLSLTMKHLPLEINVQCFINLIMLSNGSAVFLSGHKPLSLLSDMTHTIKGG